MREVRPETEGKVDSAGYVHEQAAAVGTWNPVLLGMLESMCLTGCRTRERVVDRSSRRPPRSESR